MNKLTTLATAFNEAVGDDIMHDSTLTIQLFSNLIREIRSRHQRTFITQDKHVVTQQQMLTSAAANLPSPPRRQRQRATTPPPAYSNARQ